MNALAAFLGGKPGGKLGLDPGNHGRGLAINRFL
jgi:hypothetical protein